MKYDYNDEIDAIIAEMNGGYRKEDSMSITKEKEKLQQIKENIQQQPSASEQKNNGYISLSKEQYQNIQNGFEQKKEELEKKFGLSFSTFLFLSVGNVLLKNSGYRLVEPLNLLAFGTVIGSFCYGLYSWTNQIRLHGRQEQLQTLAQEADEKIEGKTR